MSGAGFEQALAIAPLAAGLCLFALGAGLAAAARHAVKQALALGLALSGAAFTAHALVGEAAPFSALGAMAGFWVLALALAVRLKEAHGRAETDLADAADDEADLTASAAPGP